ncbi:hypothetical protein FYK55_27595 [Roseiconus nitratireducens]|uniref:Uncharacterized protein n=1 Tax=Roseiconus nitratireducens TaxID=2605748 RepID=A0A5M6CTC9_9BACT|nr:hypothetical protein [Roseiconus nitratireducens]KAA5538507.1 hypothetical protein FYK55_27595 [Roseiconus nitratireducens]
MLSDLTRRVGKLEIAMKGQWPAGGVAIDFDQLRIPYDSDDERERVRAQVASKGREAFWTGQFLTDAGWRRVTVGNSGNIESGVIRSSASSLETGLMSGILDDGKALYILHVTKRTQ